VAGTVGGNAENSVHCELDKKLKVGQVKCSVCGEQW
jgi:transcription elongation factor Elf1